MYMCCTLTVGGGFGESKRLQLGGLPTVIGPLVTMEGSEEGKTSPEETKECFTGGVRVKEESLQCFCFCFARFRFAPPQPSSDSFFCLSSVSFDSD